MSTEKSEEKSNDQKKSEEPQEAENLFAQAQAKISAPITATHDPNLAEYEKKHPHKRREEHSEEKETLNEAPFWYLSLCSSVNTSEMLEMAKKSGSSELVEAMQKHRELHNTVAQEFLVLCSLQRQVAQATRAAMKEKKEEATPSPADRRKILTAKADQDAGASLASLLVSHSVESLINIMTSRDRHHLDELLHYLLQVL